jgi:hypothetical protein
MQRFRRSARLAAFAIVTTSLFVAPGVVGAASAGTKWLYPSYAWSGHSLAGSAYSNKYRSSPLWVVTDISQVYAAVSGSTSASRVRVQTSMSIGSVGGSVTVSTGGVGAGFTASGVNCVGTPYENGGRTVSVNYGGQLICHGQSTISMGESSFTVTGSARVGTAWSVRSDREAHTGVQI